MSETFSDSRDLLVAVAYRVLGSMADAEDVVQDAWLRWQSVDRATVEDERAYLITVTTRLAIDRLRRLKARREEYIGPWLPEVVATDRTDEPAELADSVSMALLVVLESLSPLERAVFVLHDVFGFGYTEIAPIIDRTPEAVRQLGRRARDHVAERRPRFATSPTLRREVTERFLAACMGGDVGALMAALAPDVVLHGDTGGRTRGPKRPVFGADKVARLLAITPGKLPAGVSIRYAEVNGGPAAIMMRDGEPYSVFVLDIDPSTSLITTVYVVGNPAKLHYVRP